MINMEPPSPSSPDNPIREIEYMGSSAALALLGKSVTTLQQATKRPTWVSVALAVGVVAGLLIAGFALSGIAYPNPIFQSFAHSVNSITYKSVLWLALGGGSLFASLCLNMLLQGRAKTTYKEIQERNIVEIIEEKPVDTPENERVEEVQEGPPVGELREGREEKMYVKKDRTNPEIVEDIAAERTSALNSKDIKKIFSNIHSGTLVGLDVQHATRNEF